MRNKNISKKHIFGIFSFFLLLIPIIIPTNIEALSSSEIFNEDFNVEIESKMTSTHIPSCAISVVNQTGVVFEKGYGDQSALDTAYPLFSINKPLLAVAFLQLYDEGVIDLNEDINSYLPFPIRNPNWPSIPITCEHLLSHQASLRDRTNKDYLDVVHNYTIPYPDYICELLNESGSLYSVDLWQTYQPGTGYAYSTLDFDILAYILELQTGKTVNEYLANNIFTPLGLLNTKNNWTLYEQSKRAIPYIWDTNINDYVQLDWIDLGNAMDYKSTIQDLSKLLITVMNKGVYDSIRILDETAVNSMLSEQTSGDGYGYGFEVNREVASSISGLKGHIGLGPGYILIMYFKDDIGVIFFMNQNNVQTDTTIIGVMQIYKYIFEEAGKLTVEPTNKGSFNFLSFVIFLSLTSTISYIVRRKRK